MSDCWYIFKASFAFYKSVAAYGVAMELEALTSYINDCEEDVIVEELGKFVWKPCKWFSFVWGVLLADMFKHSIGKLAVAHCFQSRWYVRAYATWLQLFQVDDLRSRLLSEPQWRTCAVEPPHPRDGPRENSAAGSRGRAR